MPPLDSQFLLRAAFIVEATLCAVFVLLALTIDRLWRRPAYRSQSQYWLIRLVGVGLLWFALHDATNASPKTYLLLCMFLIASLGAWSRFADAFRGLSDGPSVLALRAIGAILIFISLADLVYRFRLAQHHVATFPPSLGMVLVAAGVVAPGMLLLRSVVESEREQHVQHAHEVQAAELSALRAERNTAIGSMAASVAHDFNNVLGGLRMSLDLMLTEPVFEESGASADLEVARAATTRGADLTRHLLRLAKHGEGELEHCVVADVVSELLPTLRRVVHGGIRLEARMDGRDKATISATAVTQIVLNLVINARDALSNGGTIQVVVTGNAHAPTRQVDVGRLDLGAHVVLSVSDNGSGIAEEVRSTMFHPFVTTKGNRGSGLGLHTVATLTQQAGGAIAVATGQEGTRFDVYLPGLEVSAAQADSGRT